MTLKQLLLEQTALAYDGRPDMSLTASLQGVTQEAATWRPNLDLPTIEQLVRHLAWAKSTYCRDAFGKPAVLDDPSCDEMGDTPGLSQEFPCGAGWGVDMAPGINGAIDLLRRSHTALVECLESCQEESLARPLPHRHGKSGAHFFSVMLMHDVYHAGQIRTRRTMRAAAGLCR
jgi:hypothetical protein